MHRPNGRRPPLPTPLRRRYAVGVQPACDLAETSPVGALPADPSDHLLGKTCPATGSRGPSRRCSRLSPPLRNEALDLVDRYEARSPAGLDRVDEGQDTADERRAAHSERRGRLGPRVGKSFDTGRPTNDYSRCCGRLGEDLMSSFLAPVFPAAARHSYNVHEP